MEDNGRSINACIHGAFYLDRCEAEACTYIKEQLDIAVTSFKKYIKDWQHSIITASSSAKPANSLPPQPKQ